MSEETLQQDVSLRARMYGWIEEKARGPHGDSVLFLTALTESSVFVVPPDVVIVALLLYMPQRWIRVATIATAGSVIGGVLGYLIGYALFETVGTFLVETYSLHEELLIVQQSFNDHAFISIFVAAFTPIPYKVFTIASGLFSINLFLFVTASIVGRGLRFFGVAFITHRFGRPVLGVVLRYFKIITLLILAGIVLALLLT